MIRGLLDQLGIDTAHLVGNSYGGAGALRLALDTPHRVDKMVLMGPGGIGTTRALPTAGLKSLLAYYGGDGPSREKLETFIRNYLVYDGASVPEEVIDAALPGLASIPRWSPTRRCAARPDRWRCARCGAWTSPATGDWRTCRHRRWCCGAATTRSTAPAAVRCC